MDKKIILIIGIVIIIVIIAAVFLNIGVSKDDTTIKMISDSSLNEYSSIKIKLSDLNETPVENQTVYIKIINKKGNVDEYSVKTDENGKAKLKLNKIQSGTYTVNFTFDGNDKYNSCNLSKRVKIVEKDILEESGNEQISADESSDSSSNNDYWETSADAPFEYHTEYDSNGGFRQYDHEGNLVGSSYDEDQDDIADYVPRRI